MALNTAWALTWEMRVGTNTGSCSPKMPLGLRAHVISPPLPLASSTSFSPRICMAMRTRTLECTPHEHAQFASRDLLLQSNENGHLCPRATAPAASVMDNACARTSLATCQQKVSLTNFRYSKQPAAIAAGAPARGQASKSKLCQAKGVRMQHEILQERRAFNLHAGGHESASCIDSSNTEVAWHWSKEGFCGKHSPMGCTSTICFSCSIHAACFSCWVFTLICAHLGVGVVIHGLQQAGKQSRHEHYMLQHKSFLTPCVLVQGQGHNCGTHFSVHIP
eukprot:1152804-Pelagomonas_calceolata.AAC.3